MFEPLPPEETAAAAADLFGDDNVNLIGSSGPVGEPSCMGRSHDLLVRAGFDRQPGSAARSRTKAPAVEERPLTKKARERYASVAAIRAPLGDLIAERPAAPVTKALREEHLRVLGLYLEKRGHRLADLIDGLPSTVPRLNDLLVDYGKMLYKKGHPYYHLSVVLTALTARHGDLRRQLGRAWDVALNWLDREPGGTTPTLSQGAVRAVVALALFWGWPRVAALLGAAFGGVLRPSEYLLAVRSQLLFPSDVLDASRTWVTWVHPLPKTRRTAARRQPSRIDDQGIASLLFAVFGRASPDEQLWPGSPESFRARFRALLRALALPAVPLQGLRGAGASAFYMHTEDTMRTMRRGRWAELATMNIYLQEAEASLVTPQLAPDARRTLEIMAGLSSWLHRVALGLVESGLPPALWTKAIRDLLATTSSSEFS